MSVQQQLQVKPDMKQPWFCLVLQDIAYMEENLHLSTSINNLSVFATLIFNCSDNLGMW